MIAAVSVCINCYNLSECSPSPDVSPHLNKLVLSGLNQMHNSTFLFHSACVHSSHLFEFTTVNRKVICHSDCVIVWREAGDICLTTIIISIAFVFIKLKLPPAQSGDRKVWKGYILKFSPFFFFLNKYDQIILPPQLVSLNCSDCCLIHVFVFIYNSYDDYSLLTRQMRC